MFPIIPANTATASFPENDEGIFGYGYTGGGNYVSMTNLVSNAGVVSSDVTGVGTAKSYLAACEYGGDKGIFGFGWISANTGVTNLVSNSGVVATDVSAVGTDVTGVGTGRYSPAACSFN